MNSRNSKQIFPQTNASIRGRLVSQPTLRDRPVVRGSIHVDDLGRRRSVVSNERKPIRLDEGSLQMTNDPNSVFYRRLSASLQNNDPIPPPPTAEEEKLKLFEQYGPELQAFLKDKQGHLKPKFDKVFII